MWFKNTYRFSPFYKRIVDKVKPPPPRSKLQAHIKNKLDNDLFNIKKPNILGIKTKIKKQR